MESSTTYPHIVVDEAGCPKIKGSRMKVQHLALAHLHHGWSALELQWQFPDLTLPQIHCALAYYYENRAALDEAMERDQQWLRDFAAQNPSTLGSELRQRRIARASGL